MLKDSEYHLTLQVATKFEFLKKKKEVELLAKHKNVEVFTIHRTEIGLYVCRPWQPLFCLWNSRQEYWSGLPFPPPGDPGRGMKPGSCALQADSLPGKSRTVKPRSKICGCLWSHFEPWSDISSGENNCSLLLIMCENVGFTILENNAWKMGGEDNV